VVNIAHIRPFREESDVWVRANLPLGPLTENGSRSPSASMRKIYNDNDREELDVQTRN